MDPSLPKSPPAAKKLPLPPAVILLLLIVVVISLSATVYLLTTSKKFEPPSRAVTEVTEPTVTLTTTYTNPFNPEVQYVNPFNIFKSPLYSLKATK